MEKVGLRVSFGTPSLTIRCRPRPDGESGDRPVPADAHVAVLPDSAAKINWTNAWFITEYEISLTTPRFDYIVDLEPPSNLTVTRVDGVLTITGDDYDEVYAWYRRELQACNEYVLTRYMRHRLFSSRRSGF